MNSLRIFFSHFTASFRYLYHLLRSLRDLFTISLRSLNVLFRCHCDVFTIALQSLESLYGLFPMSSRYIYDRDTVFTIYLRSFLGVFAITLQSPHHLSVRSLYDFFTISSRCLNDVFTIALPSLYNESTSF